MHFHSASLQKMKSSFLSRKKKTIVLVTGSRKCASLREKAQEGHHHRRWRIRKQRLQAMHNKVSSARQTARALPVCLFALCALRVK